MTLVKIEVAEKRGATRIPTGWGATPDGIETTDPKVELSTVLLQFNRFLHFLSENR